MMMRVFKFCVCLLSWIYIPCICYAAPADDARNLVVQVVDNSQSGHKGISGITVSIETTSLRKSNNQRFTAVTDDKGYAVFDNLCNEIRNRQIQGSITYKFTDPTHVFQDAVIPTNVACKARIRLNKASESEIAKYPTPQMIRQYAVNRDGKIAFYPVCKPGVALPTGVGHLCDEEFFQYTNVQWEQADLLAQLYVNQMNIPELSKYIECNKLQKKSRDRHDFLQCTSSDAKYVFEFKFKNLVAGSVDSAGGAYTIQDSTASAICRLNGGTYNNYSHGCIKDGDEQITLRYMQMPNYLVGRQILLITEINSILTSQALRITQTPHIVSLILVVPQKLGNLIQYQASTQKYFNI